MYIAQVIGAIENRKPGMAAAQVLNVVGGSISSIAWLCTEAVILPPAEHRVLPHPLTVLILR